MNMRLAEDQAQKVHLQDYLNVLLRQRVVVIAITVLVFAVVALKTSQLRPVFESGATLYVKSEKGSAGQMSDMLVNAAAPINSEIEILKSRSNAEKVVEGLHLNWQVSKRSKGMDFKILEFSSNAQRPVYQVKFLGGGRTRYGAIKKCWSGPALTASCCAGPGSRCS